MCRLQDAGADIVWGIFSPDGKTFLGRGASGSMLWDLTTGERINKLPVGRVCYTADSIPLVATAADDPTTFRVLEAKTGKARFTFRPDGRIYDIQVAADGSTVAVRSEKSDRTEEIIAFEAATGRLLSRISWPDGLDQHAPFLVSSDGETLIACEPSGCKIHRWNAEGGGALPTLSSSEQDHSFRTERPSLSADGSHLVLSGRFLNRVYLCNLQENKVLRVQLPERGLSRGIAIDPTGKSLAAQFDGPLVGPIRSRFIRIWRTSQVDRPEDVQLRASGGTVFFSTDGRLLTLGVAPPVLWDVSDGRDRFPDLVPVQELYGRRTMLSPDDRFLLLIDKNGRLRLWEVATGEPVADLRAGESPRQVIFSPDATRIVAFFAEAAPLVWSLRPETVDSLPRTEWKSAWNDLGIPDPSVGRRAVWRLAAGGNPVVDFLRDHLQRPKRIEPDKEERLVRQLNSDDFKVRRSASRQLAELGPLVVPRLREELVRSPSTETRQRIADLLESSGSESLRGIRTLEVLERIGTAEAKTLLRLLSDGAPNAPETPAARNALQRTAPGWRSPASYLDVRRW